MTIDYFDIADFAYVRIAENVRRPIPNASALLRATGIMRGDGFFVFGMELDPREAFEADYLDELAYVVGMVMKEHLGHTHYHHGMPGRAGHHSLDATQILSVSPVRLRGPGLTQIMRDQSLTNENLRKLLCYKCPPGRRPRLAVTQFRYQFLQIDDFICFRIKRHRLRQNEVSPAIQWGLPLVVSALLVLIATFTTIPPTVAAHYVLLVLAVLTISVILKLRQRIASWDVPVVRLGRTAHGFFMRADVMNEAIARVNPPRCRQKPVHNFSTIIRNLESRVSGEQHRIQMGHGWLALTVALATLILALYAVTVPPKPRAEPLPEPKLYLLDTQRSLWVQRSVKLIHLTTPANAVT